MYVAENENIFSSPLEHFMHALSKVLFPTFWFFLLDFALHTSSFSDQPSWINSLSSSLHTCLLLTSRKLTTKSVNSFPCWLCSFNGTDQVPSQLRSQLDVGGWGCRIWIRQWWGETEKNGSGRLRFRKYQFDFHSISIFGVENFMYIFVWVSWGPENNDKSRLSVWRLL